MHATVVVHVAGISLLFSFPKTISRRLKPSQDYTRKNLQPILIKLARSVLWNSKRMEIASF